MIKKKQIFLLVKITVFIFVLLTVCFFIIFYGQTSVTQNVDNYAYSLPFEKGSRFRIVQGYGGLFSHRHIAALDFEMPIGTPICAAREE